MVKEYVPASWFHELGIYKVRKRIEERLPDVGGSLFLTFTFDRVTWTNPRAAFEVGRAHLRKVFFALRQGVSWEGHTVQIKAPYCVKVEFHKDGWAHFHVILKTRKFLPGGLLNELWGLGRCNVKRITNDEFRYLLKYVTKGGQLPEWVRDMKRIRIFQTTKGFLLPAADGADDQVREADAPDEAEAQDVEPAEEDVVEEGTGTDSQDKRHYDTTIGERLQRWACMAVYVRGEGVRHLKLCRPFQEIFDHLVYAIARDGRYLGNRKIKICQERQLIPWIARTLLKTMELPVFPTPPPWEMACMSRASC
jgi:hypothetical protein